MAFIPAVNTARVIMSFTQGGQNVANQFYCEFPTQPDKSDMAALAEVIQTWWEDFIADLQSVQVNLVKIEVTDMTVENSEQAIFVEDLPQSGNDSGQPLPNNVTVSVKLDTGFTGRSKRGRQYFIGLVTTQLVDSNHLLTGMVTALQTAYSALIDAISDAGWTLVIASFVSGGVPRTTALLTPVLTASVNPTLDSQRRRLPERGI